MGFAITVRPALSSDADGIAQVHLQAWREAYVHLLPAETLAGLDPLVDVPPLVEPVETAPATFPAP